MQSVEAVTSLSVSDVEIPEKDREWVECRQIDTHYQSLASIYFGHIIFAGLLALCIGGQITVASAIGLVAVAGVCVGATQNGFNRHNRQPHIRPGNSLRHIEVQGLIWGIAWGGAVGLSLYYYRMTSVQFGLTFAVILVAGAFGVMSSAKAVRNFISIVTIGTITGLLMSGPDGNLAPFALVAIFAIGLYFLIKLNLGGFLSWMLHLRALQQAAETVQLILNDYEEQSADWLWEVDAEGHIENPSIRFAEASGRPLQDLAGRKLSELAIESSGRAVFEAMLSQRLPFREVELSLSISNETHWWKLSGRPVLNEKQEIVGMRGVATDITTAKRAEAKVSYLAHYDSLTDLPNRRLFQESAQRAVSRQSSERMLAILYLDVDHFKAINDTHGHAIGDHVLKTVAERLHSLLPYHGMVGRLGGDEFAALLAELETEAAAIELARNIVDSLAEPIFIDGQAIQSGTSIGIAFSPRDANSAEELLKCADLALYDAKQAGRGCISVFQMAMRQAMRLKQMFELDLRAGLARNQFEIYYQPLINVEDARIVSYEALLRWNHPEHGMVMPSAFIPIAEETGVIVQLGEWVLRTALDEAARWPQDLGVSVNLSPAQLRSHNLFPTILNALATSGINPERLELEITETVLMQDTEANLQILHGLRKLGVKIALDDFGTGYSSLNYLRSFPFDKIKIDRCFINEVGNRDDSKAIVRAITGLATTLGMVTTAEGVEREEQLEELRREGCTEVQGYYFSEPVPAARIAGRQMASVSQSDNKASILPSQFDDTPAVGRAKSRAFT